ncbi:MAG: DNA-protecting protein DprA [Bacteroidales bacterium]|nr:DNA-protecting protein DprA [Bacteroidales bacterium]
MTETDALTYRIAMAAYRNITIDTAEQFASLGLTPEEFFTLSGSRLAALSGVDRKYFDDARRSEALDKARVEAEFVRSKNIGAVFCNEPEFPARLKECADGPAMLFVSGNISAASEPHSVAIVGTRHCTPYGADFTKRLVHDLAESLDGLLIVSGLAYGVDICSHRAAMTEGVPTAAILAHGLNTIYPADHRNDARRIIAEGGFIATEYCSWQQIHRGNFLARNRIVAGLADVTIVIESDMKGGAMATARLAGAYNREVMALPGRVGDTYSRGCNELIASGAAAMVRDASDVISLMNWTARPKAGEQKVLTFDIPEAYVPVLDALREKPDMTVNDLCVGLSMPYSRLTALLFKMELEDFIVALPGGKYALPATNR